MNNDKKHCLVCDVKNQKRHCIVIIVNAAYWYEMKYQASMYVNWGEIPFMSCIPPQAIDI